MKEINLQLTKLTFPAYSRKRGRPGIRNHLLIMPVSGCAAIVAEMIGKNVPESIVISNQYGCSQKGDDLRQTEDVLYGIGTNPNTGAVLLVGLGCENIDPERLQKRIEKTGRTAELIIIQNEGGTGRSVQKGTVFAENIRAEMRLVPDSSAGIENLCVGLECGASDIWSGITANPVIGLVTDAVIQCGGSACFSEISELIYVNDLLGKRAFRKETEWKIRMVLEKHSVIRNSCQSSSSLSGLSERNIARGLTTQKERSIERYVKTGSMPISDVLNYGQRIKSQGLCMMDTPAHDIQSMTGMAAGGVQLILFSSGKGTPAGNPVSPVIKIASNNKAYSNMKDNFDFDAGTILTKRESWYSAAIRLAGLLTEVVSGKETASEKWKHHEFAIERIGPTY